MAEDIAQWLESLGLGQYAQAFADNGIGIEALPHLRDEDFERLGVLLGHMRRLQAAIETLSADEPPTRPVPPPSKEPEPRPAEAERRQLTVMFCDLVGSTELSGRLDPEDLREVLRRYQNAVAGPVTRYGGYLARYLGDGVLVYFGWPRAQEDQAERAIWAGLDAIGAVEGIKISGDVYLSARVGIASGQVVIGDIVGDAGRDVDAVTGETPNLAARLQGLAEPNQLVIDARTYGLVGTAFELEHLGSHDLKGFSKPVPVWYVVGKGKAESRFEAAHATRLARFIGREHELGMVRERWAQAKRAEGQVVLLTSEAGIGKSRLVQALCDGIGEERHFHLRYQCSPYHTNSAFYPIIQRLERAAGFTADDDVKSRLDKLEALLRQASKDIDTDAPLFAALLSLPGEHRYGALELSPQQQRDRTIEALINQLIELSWQRPILFVLEDAHWIDPTTEALIGEAIIRIADAPVLMVITYRPDYTPPWPDLANRTKISLNRLSREQGTEMVHTMGGDELAASVVAEIITRADGVPLFVEELTKSLLESDDDKVEVPA